MDAIGNLPPVVRQAVQPARVSQPAPAPQTALPQASPEASIVADVAQAAHARTAALKARSAADAHVLGDTSFSLYQNADGKLVTRFVNKITGDITYVPDQSASVSILA